MDTLRQGNGDIELWRYRHEDMETWRHRHEDMETWRHEDMETWRHGDMETWRHGHIKRKTESQANFLSSFSICSLCRRKLTKEQTEALRFANGLNRLNELNGLAHLCSTVCSIFVYKVQGEFEHKPNCHFISRPVACTRLRDNIKSLQWIASP